MDSPFAVLTLIAAPAVLTNASSVLALGTSNRFARAVDRQRELSHMLDSDKDAHDPAMAERRFQSLESTEHRAQLLIRAMRACYISLGSFAAASLVSVLAAATESSVRSLNLAVIIVTLAIGTIGFTGLMTGSILLIRETRLALQNLREEAAFSRQRLHERRAARPPLPQSSST